MDALFVILFLGVILMAFAFWYWLDANPIRHALGEAKQVSIAEAPENAVVRIVGQVVEGETLVAPLTGRRCVYYVATLEEYRSSGRFGWNERVREIRGVQFAVDDGTGRAIVDPTGALIDVDIDTTTRSGTFDDPTPMEVAFLERHGLKGTDWIFNKKLRYREGVFEVGEPITVMCQPVREPDPDAASRAAGYRDGSPTRLRVGGSAKYPILLSDARDITHAHRR
jgi:hypothetical protein